MTVGELRAALSDPLLFDHTEVAVRVMDQSCDYQFPDDDAVSVLDTTVDTTGKRVLVIMPSDRLVLMFPNKRTPHL
jgi:hypothetical protein